MLKILIVDDEPLAREGLRIHLQAFDDVTILGECGNGNEAIRAIHTLQPDLVFLDIQMPRVTGFDVIKSVGAEQMPPVIFLTAYDEHAIDAFEVQALDYLLKPLDPQRLASSLQRARDEIGKRDVAARAQQFKDLLDQSSPSNRTHGEDRITVRNAGHVYFIQPSDILWIEASGDYVTLHRKDRAHLLRDTMQNMEKRLMSHGFRRIHRSYIVNLKCIVELIANDNGDYQVVLNTKQTLKLSRSFRDELYAALNANQ
jgi:two-component system LytT family response regulator